MSDSSKKEISDGLLWINQRALPITGLILAITTCYLVSFAYVEKIPLSMTTIVTIVPVLFLRIVFILTVLIYFTLSPILRLFPLSKSENDIDLLRFIKSTIQNSSKKNPISLRMAIGWIATIFIIESLIVITIYHHEEINIIIQIILLFIIIPLVAALIFIIFFPQCGISFKKWKKELSRGLIFDIFLRMFHQVIIMFLVLWISYLFFKNSQNQSIWMLAMYAACISAILGLIQIIGIIAIFTIKNKQQFTITKFVWTYLVIIFVLGILPTSGAWLTRVALTTTTGGRSCTILSLKNPDSKELESFRDLKNPKQTKPLRIFIGDDGKYIARINDKSDSKRLEFIPFSIVTGIDECPKEKTTKNSPK